MPDPTLYRRRATSVQAMQLVTPRDLHVAELWMRAHGVHTAHRHPALTGRGLLVPTGPRSYVTATLGQWLTHDQASGLFDVADDDVFRLLHALPVLAAVVDATQ